MITLSEALSNFSGTTNYVAKYTPTGNVLGISQIFDNGSNVGIGTNTPSSQFQIATSNTSIGSYNFSVVNSGNIIFAGLNNGYFGINCTPTKRIEIYENVNGDEFIKYTNISSGINARTGINIVNDLGSNLVLVNTSSNYTSYGAMSSNKSVLYSGNDLVLMADLASRMIFATGNTPATEKMTLLPSGNFGIGATSPTSKLQIIGTDSTSSNYSLKVDNSASSPLLYVRNDGVILANNLPTSPAGLPSGAIWNNSGVLNIV